MHPLLAHDPSGSAYLEPLFWCGSVFVLVSMGMALWAALRPQSVTVAASIGNAVIGLLLSVPLVLVGFPWPWVACIPTVAILAATVLHVRRRGSDDEAQSH